MLSSCIKQDASAYSYEENLELLWQIIDEKHCYFEEKGIDWVAIGDSYMQQIDSTTNDYAFFAICADMLDELQDGHTGISSDFNHHSYNRFYLESEHNFNYNIIERNYLEPNPIKAGGFKAQKINQVGYIYYETFMNFTGREYLQSTLAQLGDIQGLIIDIRNNTGGMIVMADSLATCFVAEDTTVAYSKYKEGPEHDNFSQFYPYTIGPEDSTAVVYDGNIVLLTNRLVYSAANTFAAIMSVLPNVTLIGDTTGGGGGMPSGSELYNGWQVWTSTNPTYDINKNSIENGIVPDIRVDLSKDDEYNGVDAIIETAINYLKNKD